MARIFEFIFTAAIAVAGFYSSRTEAARPFRIEICVVRADQTAVTMEVWSDLVDRYLWHYPGTRCGACGKILKCPGEK
jgi:hypothetical protein